jgi:hypothetical protein
MKSIILSVKVNSKLYNTCKLYIWNNNDILFLELHLQWVTQNEGISRKVHKTRKR